MAGAAVAMSGASVSATTKTKTKTSKIQTSGGWSVVAGVFSAVSLLVLKVMQLNMHEPLHVLDDLFQNFGDWLVWHWTEWVDLGVILVESLFAGAAISLVFNVVVNHVSRTINNIWSQISSHEPGPISTMTVDSDTRDWVRSLTVSDIRRAREEAVELRAQLDGVRASLAASQAKYDADCAQKDGQIRKLSDDLGRMQANMQQVVAWFNRFESVAQEAALIMRR